MTFKTNAMITVLLFSLSLGQTCLARGMSAASNPSPSHQATDLIFTYQTLDLSWTGSILANRYQVYWGTDSNALELYTTTSSTSLESPPLEPATTYYWRVDSLSSTDELLKGPLWQFQTAIPAFPGAEGFGRWATGGRGGSVYHVTNLNDSGSGSFRDAVSGSNRYVVFDVGGIIYIDSRIVIHSNVTVAGQTAPGGGITVYGNGIALNGDSGNSIIRHIRFRMGVGGDSGKDALGVSDGQNFMLDHVSITWGRDGTVDINGSAIDNITLQNCIIGQGVNNQNHSTGGLMQSGKNSVIRSLYIDNKTRNPKGRGVQQFVNTVLYNWGTNGYILGDTSGLSQANIMGCYMIKGPSSSGNCFNSATSSFHVYAWENWYDSNKNGILDGANCSESTYGPVTFESTPYPYPTINNLMTPTAAYYYVADHVGPSLVRDEVDEYLVSQLLSAGSQGSIIDRETDNPIANAVGTVANGTPPLDTDQDGMPDNWEIALGSNPSTKDHNGDVDGNGYTNLEDYLNFLGQWHLTAYMDTPLNIDLSTYCPSFPADANYLLDEVVHGSVELLEDGHTARVTPDEGFAGLTKLTFTVQDNAGNRLYLTLALLVDPSEAVTLPETMTWQNEPSANSLTSVTMSAAPVLGLPGVEYYFSATSIGGNDSGWQSDSAYTDTDLEPGTSYSYTVMARVDTNPDDVTQPSEEITVTTPDWPELDNPLAYWPLNERRGSTADDETGNGSDGTLIGNVTRVNGVFGLGLGFNQSLNNYVQIPSNSFIDLGDEDFSLSLWINEPISQSAGEHSLIIKGTFSGSYDNGSGKRYQLYRKTYDDGRDHFRFAIDDNSTKSEMSIDASEVCTDEWVHIVAIRNTNSNQLRLYGNGTLLGTLTDSTGSVSQNEPMFFGAGCDLLDDIRVYGFVLSELQIEAIGLGL